MINLLPQTLVFLGSALMAYNIYRYVHYAQGLLRQPGWHRERQTLTVPIALLILFLTGYLIVGLLGDPDFVVAGILFGGSLFVFTMIVFLQHFTERVEENERLAAQLAIEQESNRAKTSFLSTMSHEIRTPLNAIIGLDTLLLNDPDLTSLQRDRLTKMDVSARHLLLLINDILDMSRIEAGQVELVREEFSLQELVEHVGGIVESQCTVKGLDFFSEIRGKTDARYRGDKTKLSQVLINILGNSVKFTDAPGTVRLIAEQSGSSSERRQLRFVMSDTGIGIDEEYIPQIFAAFTQEDAATTNRYGGSGLGMAIAKSFVDMMDGTIDVQSTKGEGTTITVTVMVEACVSAEAHEPDEAHQAETDAQPGDADGTPAAGDHPSIAGRRVLVAEDIDINAEILAAILGSEGIVCTRAHDGQEAVELFESQAEGAFDAILMDVRMPRMDGLAATRTIRALDHPDATSVPIIALTANAFEDDVRQSLDAGMNAHLAKPVEPDYLIHTLRELWDAAATR